ncbi:deoxyribose-phosphate aldolase [Bosea sp. ANAM02]|uniref:deoxyribose-phosphate aldolase n=1 Tax=Bosea sp. ANAM02 TaxID=2020412 RepID=UPI00140EEF27|nr:deoxyribose-phosphate aldolase [Bosea sp. ANAM02]BCB17268.1 deoxyribose-phosphate aldolase [Bosea sp. ANAM02]
MSDTDLARRALALLDLTDLADDATAEGARDLCRRAVSGPVPVAAVCLWPRFVATARAELGDGPVRIATVVNFPDGDTPIAPAMRETEEALAAGADEIDLVLPWRAVLAGQTTAAAAMVRNVKMLCEERRLKVILETGEYPNLDKVRTTAELAIASGADFIKTSTGKTTNAASIPAARVMLNVIAEAGRPIGLKPSGGIRTLADARRYLDLADAIMGEDWATPTSFRFGASGLYGALVEAVDGATPDAAPRGSY